MNRPLGLAVVAAGVLVIVVGILIFSVAAIVVNRVGPTTGTPKRERSLRHRSTRYLG